MDACEIANFLAKELFLNQFASFDGIHSGVPTRTTPTLTPTTLKNIQQTFIELTNETQGNIPCQAGFVPPPFEEHSQDREASRESLSTESDGSWRATPQIIEDLDSKSSTASMAEAAAPHGQRAVGSNTGGRMLTTGSGGHATPDMRIMAALTNSNSSNSSGGSSGGGGGPSASGLDLIGGGAAGRTGGTGAAPSRRNMGGRRPHKASNLSPEEEEKRRIRRERNKQAAARCRRRREDHTNELVDETDKLEKRKQALQNEIQQLQQEKEDLTFLLDSHRDHCRQHNRSPLEVKPEMPRLALPPEELPMVDNTLKIKSEPEEYAEQPPPPKKLKLPIVLSNDNLDTPTPTSIAPLLSSIPKSIRNFGSNSAIGGCVPSSPLGKPARPGSLILKQAEFPLLNTFRPGPSNEAMDVGISTPSSGLFNFSSLMEGGTGLTPIAAPIDLPANRNPLELITPTSTEPSKLCSL